MSPYGLGGEFQGSGGVVAGGSGGAVDSVSGDGTTTEVNHSTGNVVVGVIPGTFVPLSGEASPVSLAGGGGWPGALTISDGTHTPVSSYGEALGPYVLAAMVYQNPPDPPNAADGSAEIAGVFVSLLEGSPSNTINSVLYANALLVRLDLNGYNDSAIATYASATGEELDISLKNALNVQNVRGYYAAVILDPALTASGEIESLYLIESDTMQGSALTSGLTITNLHGGHFTRPIQNWPVTLCTLTNGSRNVTVVSGGFPNVAVGMTVTDAHGTTNIPANTTVSSISGDTLVLSVPATGTTTETLTFSNNVTVSNAFSLWADVGQFFKTSPTTTPYNEFFNLQNSISGLLKPIAVDPSGDLVIYNSVANTILFTLSDTGVLTLNSQKIRGVANGTLSSDVATVGQLPPGVSSSQSGGVYGDGSDGTITFDGTTTYAGFTTTTGTAPNLIYTLTRDIYAASITLSASKVLNTAGFRIFCQGTFTNNGVIQNNGTAGSAAGGAGGGANGPGGTGAAAGGAGSTTNGSAGTAQATAALGGSGGIAGTGSAGTAGAAGTATAPTTNAGYPRSVPSAITGTTRSLANYAVGASGGGGGGDSTNHGGGGGGGGGWIMIAAFIITGTGTIEANGGNGGSPTTTILGAGGGGAGGGGAVIIISSTVPLGGNTITTSAASGTTGGTATFVLGSLTIEANGGTGGSLQGTGTNGTGGNFGSLFLIPAAA